MPEALSPDWPRIIRELRMAGVTYEGMSLHCGEYHSWTMRVRDKGMEPKYASGTALLELHREKCR